MRNTMKNSEKSVPNKFPEKSQDFTDAQYNKQTPQKNKQKN